MDKNTNQAYISNSAFYPYPGNTRDFSSLDFEVVGIDNNKTENAKEYVVAFKDGFGNTINTQKVKNGKSAVEPVVPKNKMYLFSGWDLDFSSVKSDMIVTAQWIMNPDADYDKPVFKEYQKGDVNLDGKINIKDATYLQRYKAELAVFYEAQLKLADFDGNSVVNVADVTAMQRKLAGV